MEKSFQFGSHLTFFQLILLVLVSRVNLFKAPTLHLVTSLYFIYPHTKVPILIVPVPFYDTY